jgi:hypothetical protein
MFGTWGRKRSLEQAHGTTRVQIPARVASSNLVESPLTGTHAAVFEWLFYVRSANPSFGRSDNPLHDVRQLYHLVGSRRLGDELLLESAGSVVHVPLREAALRFPHARESGRLVNRDLPPDFSHLMDNPAPRQGPLVYHELALFEGDQVTLTATVEPLPEERGGAYRSNFETARAETGRRFETRPDFLVRADLGPLVVEDQKGATSRPT